MGDKRAMTDLTASSVTCEVGTRRVEGMAVSDTTFSAGVKGCTTLEAAGVGGTDKVSGARLRGRNEADMVFKLLWAAAGGAAKTGMACNDAANFFAESFAPPTGKVGSGVKEEAAAAGVPKCVTVEVEPRESKRADTDACQPQIHSNQSPTTHIQKQQPNHLTDDV